MRKDLRDPEQLLRYDGFVHALARSLADDARSAADSAQQTMLAANPAAGCATRQPPSRKPRFCE